jgi:hypothetical protein
MAIRYRWFRIKLPGSSQDFANAFSRIKLGANSLYGFAVSEAEDGTGHGYRFLWRTKVLVTSLDEDGTPRVQAVDSVDFTDFRISRIEGIHFLRIENPGRNSRDLFNALESIFGMGFTVQPVLFDRTQPSTFFNDLTSSKLVGLKIIDAVAGENVVARMEFASKEGFDPQRLEVLRGLSYKVEHAAFEVLFQGLRGHVSFASSGIVKINGKIASKLASLIEADLPHLVGNSSARVGGE